MESTDADAMQWVQRILQSPVGHARGTASESPWRKKEKNSQENVWSTSKSGMYILINVKQIAIATWTTPFLSTKSDGNTFRERIEQSMFILQVQEINV